MNGSNEMIDRQLRFFKENLQPNSDVQMVIAPTFLHLNHFLQNRPSHLFAAAQNCSNSTNGARTGEVSAAMLKEIKCEFVIIGHSERRIHCFESAEILKEKMKIAFENGLKVIFCVGENLEDLENGKSEEKLLSQLKNSICDGFSPDNLIIAYEPVWAIGTGKTPKMEEIAKMTKFISNSLQKISEKCGLMFEKSFKILYGGSVSANNVAELVKIQGISGFLVGGASLNEKEFLAIYNIIAA